MHYQDGRWGYEFVLDEGESLQEVLIAIIKAAAEVPWWPKWEWHKGIPTMAQPETLIGSVPGKSGILVNKMVDWLVPLFVRIVVVDPQKKRFRLCSQPDIPCWRAEPILIKAQQILVAKTALVPTSQ
jgi:hypothetical protein